MTPKQILIYRDKGADPFCIEALVAALRQELAHQKYSITFADRKLLQTASWHDQTKLLIFPGGRDIPYHKALHGCGNQQIVDFVQKGGSFLGICAGGYYASAHIEFEKGGPLEVIASRDLRFFPGHAVGPAYGPGTFGYRGQKGAQIATLELGSTISASYYHGGCAFIGEENNPNISVLARYADLEKKPPAIIRCTVGRGMAILSGVHPEYSAYHSNAIKHLPAPLFSALQKIEPKRRLLFTHLLKELEVVHSQTT
ncbi:MAG: hypothetical protein K2Y01_06860 [Rhabdochlamydiaceae bacterium]|nr:hypothetical protein [Rhabdochlamydiaceae bacterium]